MCKKKSTPETAYVYVVVRRDLPFPHLVVQAVHAAIAGTFAYGQPNKTHPHVVVCTVEDEASLEALFERLKHH